jgi:hypothetical protein
MDLRSKFFLSCLAVGAVALSPAQGQSAPRANAAAGAGAHFNNAMARVSGGSRPIASGVGRSTSPGAYGGRQWSGNGSGRHWSGNGSGRWTGNGSGRWTGNNGNWRHHRHHYYPGYYGGYYPYFGYGWGYPYYGVSTSLYYDGYASGYAGNGSGNLVASVQQRLARAGYYRGAIDGVIGNGTRRAIRSYERSHGLPVDGRIDDDLLGQLGLS